MHRSEQQTITTAHFAYKVCLPTLGVLVRKKGSRIHREMELDRFEGKRQTNGYLIKTPCLTS